MDILDRINQAINNGITGDALMPLLKEARSELQATRRVLADAQAEANALRARVSELEMKAAAAGAASVGGHSFRDIKEGIAPGGISPNTSTGPIGSGGPAAFPNEGVATQAPADPNVKPEDKANG